MKYKVGDKVRIKSLDWYNKNKDEYDYIDFGKHMFYPPMSKYCGEVFTIDYVYSDFYTMNNNDFEWTDGMIECKVEDETKPMTYEDAVEIIETMQGIGDSWECPQGYQFVDENGNVINATKIVLEKKGKEYPKTYEECYEVLDIIENRSIWHGYRSVQLKIFQKLLICRDAYWKIAGEEMGLGKPWEPQGANTFSIFYDRLTGEIEKQDGYCGANSTLEFSTAEMRDAFYENFKELINECKELL